VTKHQDVRLATFRNGSIYFVGVFTFVPVISVSKVWTWQ